MDEIINIKVNGNSVTKDYNVAGTQYEANRTKLRISFSENWSGYAKSVTFWNAVGENPVKILLGTDLLENILENDSVYIVPIPGEAMTEGGKCSFVIEGAKDGVNARTVEDSLKVLYSPKADNAGQAVDPTPTQAEQLRAEMDAVMDDIASAKEAAIEASDAVEEVRNMSVSCETLDVGATPTVDKSFDDGRVNLHFGIPTSVEGIHIGAEAPTDPLVKVWIDTDGEAEDDMLVTKGELEVAMSGYEAILDRKADLSDLDGKVDKVTGKGLSSNDFTDEWKQSIGNAFDEAMYAQTELDRHMTDKTNPHKVTAAQVGAYTKDEADIKFISTTTYVADQQYFDGLITQNSDDIADIKTDIGDIDSALDAILAIQNELIGGVAE